MIDALLGCDRCSMIYRADPKALRSTMTRRCLCGAELYFDVRLTLRAALNFSPAELLTLDQLIAVVRALDADLRASA